MISLRTLLEARLTNVVSNADGSIQARCPCCAASGQDKTGNHLRVFASGAFNCAKQTGDREHNKAIRAFLYNGIDASILPDTVYIDPTPKLDVDPVYPESMLAKLIPDHTYWFDRGISESVLAKLEGGVAPVDEKNKLSGRHILPIRHHRSRKIMGFTGRLIDDASFGPSWKHLFRSGRAVYPLTVTEPAIRKANKVVLVESVGDLLSCMTVGIECCLVLFGLNLNSRMVGFLVGANLDQVIISTNKDDARVAPDGKVTYPGQEAAQKVRAKLAAVLGDDRVSIRLPTLSKDWNDSIRDKTGELEVFKGELGL